MNMEKEKDMTRLQIFKYILRWILVMIVFVASSISLWWTNDPQGIWTAIWCLSIVKLVDMADE